MSFEPVGTAGTGISTKSELQTFSPLDERSGGNISGYVTLSGTLNSSIQTVPKPERGRSVKHSGAPARRDEIRRCLLKAKDAAGNLETNAEIGDWMELSLEGFRLKESLSDLWQLRSEREDNWGDLLNLLQGALAQEDFERFSAEQCYAIHTIVADHLAAGAVGEDDLEQSVVLLRKAGFDPWKAISGSL